jgi:hypothetical protein
MLAVLTCGQRTANWYRVLPSKQSSAFALPLTFAAPVPAGPGPSLPLLRESIV